MAFSKSMSTFSELLNLRVLLGCSDLQLVLEVRQGFDYSLLYQWTHVVFTFWLLRNASINTTVQIYL